MSHRSQQIYEFESFRLDVAERLLLRDGDVVPLQPKVFDLLLALVEHQGRLLEKDELMKLVWPDTVVEEANLANNISILRKTLGENGQQFIETVPKRGYRFVAQVREVRERSEELAATEPVNSQTTVAAEPETDAQTMPPGGYQQPEAVASISIRPALWRLLAVALGVSLIAVAVISFTRRSEDRGVQIKSLAVIPFDNFSGDPGQEYLADGMTEALITELSKIGSLRVTSRTSVMQYKAARKPLPEIGRELSVDVIVAGSVQRSGDKIGITAQLIRATTDQHLWAYQYERDLRDLLSLQREVARAIANEINVKLTPKEQGLLANARPINPEALDAYLKGRDYFNQGINFIGRQTVDLLKTSLSYFEQSVRIDPNFSLGHAGMADACNWLADFGGLSEFAPRAKEAARRALEIDETLAQAHSVLARNLWRFDWDWASAERKYKRAIELDPNTDAHHGYATYLMYLGRFDQAMREMNLSLELDPLTIPKRYNAALLYSWARQHDRAIEQFRRLADTQPNNPQMHVGLGQAYMLKGMYEEGVAELRKASDVTGGGWSIHLAWGYAVSGNRSEAIKILDENLKRVSSGQPVWKVNIAYVYIALGDRDQALAWLEKAYQERSHRILVLKSEPRFDSLRSDPRYQDLLRRIGFEP